MKGYPSIICIDNTFEGINDCVNYYLLKLAQKIGT